MTAKWQAGRTYVPGSFVIPTKAAPTKPPPITNGDFETGDTTGWDISSPTTWTIDQDPYQGTYSLKYDGDSDGDGGAFTSKVEVKPGQLASGAAMFKATHHEDSYNDGALALVFLDSSGSIVGAPVEGNFHGAAGEEGGVWRSLYVSHATPAGAVKVMMQLRGASDAPGSSWCNFDTVSVSVDVGYIPDGLIYEATQADPGKSGATEPAWPGQVGIPVTDNEVTWEGRVATSITWEASPIMETGDTEPTWPAAIGGVVRDGTVNWTAVSRRITDENCPNSKVVAIMASKVFAADGDIVRFSATVNPLDWTSEQNAGYLPTGLQQANANAMAVLAPYRSNLTTFNASSFQNWQVDPDPAAMAILDQMEGIGSTHQKAAQPVGNELFYLSQLGVRTVSIAGGADNLKAGDVGMPIDSMVQAAVTGQQPALATYYPSSGQYWLAFRDYIPLVLSGDLPDGTVGTSVDYSYTATGGIPPYTLSIDSGALPDGLTMDDKGRVTGTPTAGGTFTWTVKAVDSAGHVATLNDAGNVAAVPAIVDNSGNISTISLKTYTRIAGVYFAFAKQGRIYCASSSAYSEPFSFVTTSADGKFETHDLISPNVDRGGGFDVSFDGKYIVSTGSGSYGKVSILYSDSGNTYSLIKSFDANGGSLDERKVRISPDGTMAAISDSDKKTNHHAGISVWSLSGGVATRILRMDSDPYYFAPTKGIAWSHDSNKCYFDGSEWSYLIDASDRNNLTGIRGNSWSPGISSWRGNQFQSVVFYDNDTIFIASDAGIKVFDISSGTPVWTDSWPLIKTINSGTGYYGISMNDDKTLMVACRYPNGCDVFSISGGVWSIIASETDGGIGMTIFPFAKASA